MHGKEVAMAPLWPRTFLTTAATAAGSVALGCGDHPMIAPTRAQLVGCLLPDPASCGIEHVVVFMMENRSFDHFLGWLPGADGRQTGLTYADSSGVTHSTFPLAPDFQGCSYNDPDHSYAGGRVEYNNGACDGWLRAIDPFSADCAAATLPHVAFVDGIFLQELTGTGADDHPYGDIRAGEAMMNRIYAAVTQSLAWRSTVLVINFDEWGGFFDHVPPPVAPIPPADRAAGNADGRLGFRTPTLLISPFAPRQHTSHIRYDHTSVLRMIEGRGGLAPLTVRDATANNLAVELDFTQVNPAPPPVSSVPAVIGAVCPVRLPGLAAPALPSPRPARAHWAGLREVARRHGWRTV